jgi:non-ribosomal peptide synthetase component F
MYMLQNLGAVISNNKINTLMAVTPTFLAAIPYNQGAFLNLVCAGGEVFSTQLMQSWTSMVKFVFNVYGPTEAAVWVCAAR